VELFKAERGTGDMMKDFRTPLKAKDAKPAPKDAQ
jgi:hypothetical protein